MSKKYMKTNNLGQKPQDAGGYSAKRKQLVNNTLNEHHLAETKQTLGKIHIPLKYHSEWLSSFRGNQHRNTMMKKTLHLEC